MKLPALLTTALLASTFLAASAFADPFTYQGRLAAAGAPADGSYDFEFRVFDAALGGSQIGVAFPAPAVNVAAGLFTASIDVGAALPASATATNRFLEIRVRPAGAGAYTTLTPREPIQPAPLAQRALREWLAPVNADTLTNDAARTHLFLNRTGPLSSAEYFGLTTPTGASSFGGMYINTASATGLPFYGYATNNGIRAWTTFDGVRNQWQLTTQASVRLNVDDLGNVGIGIGNAAPAARLDVQGTVLASTLAYRTPQTRTLSYSPVAFTPANSGAVYSFSPFRVYLPSSIAQVYCPVSLPNGATVTSVSIAFEDFTTLDDAQILLQAYRYTAPIGPITLAGANSSGAPGNGVATTTTIANAVIDNTNFTYHLTYRTLNRSGNDSVTMRAAIISYTVTQPD